MTTHSGLELVSVYADGAFGTVCLAEDHDQNGKIIAIKVLKSDHTSQPDTIRRVRDEARMLRRLRHPNIVEVHQLFELRGRPVILMEWVNGVSLEELVRKHPNGVPLALVISIIAQTADALHSAYHTIPAGPSQTPMRIIHRDIKPSNILITADGVVKLVDFGQAKGTFGDREAVTVAFVLGSHGYNAPERMDGVIDSPAVDVYALGLTMFELLTGRKAVISLREDKHNPGVSKHQLHLTTTGGDSDSLKAIGNHFAKMCRYKPDERPSPEEVGQWMRALQNGSCSAELARTEAAQAIAPLIATRSPEVGPDHPTYRDLAKLINGFIPTENDGLIKEPTDEIELVDRSTELISMLSTDGWEADTSAIEMLMMTSKTSVAPLVEVVRKSSLPWWVLWGKRSTSGQVDAALQLLDKFASKQVAMLAKETVKR